MNDITCPACDKPLKSRKAVPAHVNTCRAWPGRIPVPPSEFNFDRHFGTGLYAEGLLEGRDYVTCRLCDAPRSARLSDHLRRVHGLSVDAYLAEHPGAPTRSEASVEAKPTRSFPEQNSTLAPIENRQRSQSVPVRRRLVDYASVLASERRGTQRRVTWLFPGVVDQSCQFVSQLTSRNYAINKPGLLQEL